MTVQTSAVSQVSRLIQNADELLKKYATQTTTALGVVVCLTGVMMFFKWYKGEVEAMHEWLGVGFVVAVILHMTRHRKSLSMMLAQNRTRIVLFSTAMLAVAFLVLPSQKAGSPVKQTLGAVMRAPLGDIAPVFGLSTEEAVARLSEAGISNIRPSESIETMAKANKTSSMTLLNAVINNNDKD